MDAQTVFENRRWMEIVDVREDHEWEAGRIQGARHLPMDQLPQHLDEIGGRKVVTVCRSGDRSARMAGFLREKGYDAEHMEGGLEAWAEIQLPLVGPDGRAGEVT